MRPLSSVPNIGTATTAYPDGLIVDNASGITGTAVTEILYGDLIQTVHKLRRLAGITPNSLPDNETNGFQFLTALLRQGLPYWQAPTANVDFSGVKFVQHANGIYYHISGANTSNPPASDTANWAFVLGWNGAQITFANDTVLNASLAALEGRATALEGRATALEGRMTTAEADIGSLEAGQILMLNRFVRKGYVGTPAGGFFNLGDPIIAHGAPIVSFILKALGFTYLTLPSETVLATYFGYTQGVVITVVSAYDSTQTLRIDDQLIDRGGNVSSEINLGRGESISMMFVKGIRDWQTLSRNT